LSVTALVLTGFSDKKRVAYTINLSQFQKKAASNYLGMFGLFKR